MSDVLGLLGAGLLANLARVFESRFSSRADAPAFGDGNDLAPHWTESRAADLVGQGLSLLDAGQAQAALPVFLAAGKKDDACEQARLGLACALDALGKPQAAADRLASLVRSETPDPSTLFAFGYCSERAGQARDAMKAYKRTVALCPQLCNARERLTAMHLMRGESHGAIRQCEAIQRGDPGRTDIRRALAVVCLNAGQPRDALAHYETALTLEPDAWSAHDDEADALQREGRHEDAIRALERLAEEQPGFADTYLRLGDRYATLDRHQEAIDQYARAIELHPDYLEAASKLGAQLLHLGRRRQAAKWFAHGMEISDRLLSAYAGLGLGHWHLGQESKALDNLRMAMRLEPNSALLFSEVARIRGQFKRARAGAPDADDWIDDAANAYREQLDGHANHAQWHYQLGQLLSHAGDRAAATEHYREAVTINPAYQKAWIKLALLHGDAGESREAFRAVGFALNPDAELIRLHYQLAIIFTLPTRFDICLDQLEGKADAKRPLADARANVQLALENLGLLDPIASGWQAAPPAQETPVA